MSAPFPRTALGFGLCGAALILCLAAAAPAPAPPPRAFTAAARDTALRAIERPRGTVPVNSGDLWDLVELPGVGETLAGYILAEREAHGAFHYPEDLLVIRGIGEKKVEGFRELLDLSEQERP